MNLTVKPAVQLKGRIRLPSSKSYSIRAHIIAACGGTSRIINPSNCEDALVAQRIARHLKTNFRRVSRLHVGESGTVLRFLLPLVGLQGRPVTVVGEGTLRGRPNVHLTRALRSMGVDIKGSGAGEGIPIKMRGGALRAGRITIDGSLSSQFISALLIACPKLTEDTRLVLTGKRIVSTDYIQMTIQTLRAGGIKIKQKSLRDYRVKGNQMFNGLGTFYVPSDYGLAAFLMAAALLNTSTVRLDGHLPGKFIQADGHILGLLKKMGAKFQKDARSIRIKGPCRLKGGTFSLKNCPDLVPVMAVLALFAKGRTRLTHIAHVRTKESDRISDLRKELVRIGADIRERRDSLTIVPQPKYKSGRTLNPHHDHRLAMAFCVLGSKIGARVKDIECTRKSYPDFVRDFKALGAKTRTS